MATLVARRNFSTGFFRVEMIATDAVKSDFAALSIVKTMITAIIINPQKTEHAENQQTVENNIERKIRGSDHVEKFT